MADILYLVHRLPWPPDKGDKIRSHHLLRHLAERHRVHLGTFIDDPADWDLVPAVRRLCASLCVRSLPPARVRFRALTGLLNGEPLTLPWYRDRYLRRWVRQTLDGHWIRAAVAFSSTMGQYLPPRSSGVLRVVDFVDVDSDKWRQYAEHQRGAMAAVYRRESRRLFEYERALAGSADACLFVSEQEVATFRSLVPECANRVHAVANGVDAHYFDPEHAGPCPYAEGRPVLVFTGAMDYWPNVDAVGWFADEVLPRLRREWPGLVFAVVGSRPSAPVRALAQRPGVLVTGGVPDIRPWMAHADVVVAPLRLARGVQNKVLEAMAMARPVVATPQALEGIRARPGVEVAAAEAEAEAFAAAVTARLGGGAGLMGQAARRRILSDYSWAGSLAAVDRLVEGPSPVDGRLWAALHVG
ncbi:TIGR03087 family PEP-CTERM/XrtA system glycosyltransferase [Halorhodospira sp. 9622]|uniref:TIGR03087 family PEP-CTERM/XrtA system glycosyltransferase n=1 Tax=Halorhodospira sp. 9622 TaxID=2899136 RepID=UPI001EE92A5D|nr:TIGR03087 family PEP-CTERM/XrtA system glycosyltransferase [Halorhodospira sp. 9622]